MMYEAFRLTLNQVTGSIGQDAMSMELLCIIDDSHRIDKNISKIASIVISVFFFLKWQKAPVHIKHKKSPMFPILKQFWLGANLGNDKPLPNQYFYMEQNGLTCFAYIFICGVSFASKRETCLLKVLFCKLLGVWVLLLTPHFCLSLHFTSLYQWILKD